MNMRVFQECYRHWHQYMVCRLSLYWMSSTQRVWTNCLKWKCIYFIMFLFWNSSYIRLHKSFHSCTGTQFWVKATSDLHRTFATRRLPLYFSVVSRPFNTQCCHYRCMWLVLGLECCHYRCIWSVLRSGMLSLSLYVISFESAMLSLSLCVISFEVWGLFSRFYPQVNSFNVML